MTTFNLTCEAVEATLADYLDETLEPWVRSAIEEHLAGCARCTDLARELGNIARETAALPSLLPEQEIWPNVAARIGASGDFAEPVAESAESGSPAERVVFSSDSFLPVEEEPRALEESLVLITDSPVVTSDLPLATSQPMLTAEPAVETRETPPPTKEPPSPRSEPASVEHEVPVPTPAPLTLADEPPRSRTATTTTTTTAPSPSLAAPRQERWGPLQIALAAAALVLVTATTSSLLTVRLLGRPGTPSVASTAGTGKASPTEKSPSSEKKPSSEQPPVERTVGGQLTERQPVEPDLSASTPVVPPMLTVSAAASPSLTRSPEEIVYDREINTLSRIVRRKKTQLDPSTVTVIDKNLGAVDAATAQIRAALEEDPSNSLLEAQASRALEMKLELLRRAAMMGTTTSL
jgi:hypothetical protein